MRTRISTGPYKTKFFLRRAAYEDFDTLWPRELLTTALID
jgi:hypothetical protein